MNKSRIPDEIAAAMAEWLGLFKKVAEETALKRFRTQLAQANTCNDLAKLSDYWINGRGAGQLYADGGEEAYAQAMRELKDKKSSLGCS